MSDVVPARTLVMLRLGVTLLGASMAHFLADVSKYLELDSISLLDFKFG